MFQDVALGQREGGGGVGGQRGEEMLQHRFFDTKPEAGHRELQRLHIGFSHTLHDSPVSD